MKKTILAISIILIVFTAFSQENTPTTLYGCFEYFDKIFTEEEKEILKNWDSPDSIYTPITYGAPNDFISQTAAYKEGKLKFIWKNRGLYSNIVPDGYPSIHFESYPGMIYRSYYYLLKYGDCRWDFLLKAYMPWALSSEYRDTGILKTIYPDNIDDADLQKTYFYSCTFYKEKVLDTILFFKNNLNETYIYSFAYSWRKIPEKDFDYLLNNQTDSQIQAYFDELFKDSPFIGGL